MSSSPAPSGTDGSGHVRDGQEELLHPALDLRQLASAPLRRSESAFIRPISSEASFFSRRSRPISSEAALRSARIFSTSASRSRRLLSSSTNPPSDREERRFLSISSTAGMLSRTNFRSSIGRYPASQNFPTLSE